MSLREYLGYMSFGTVLCWVAWFFVIYSLDPFKVGWFGFVFFYLSLFLALLGTISVAGFLVKRAIIHEDEIVFRHVRRTFRQSVVIALAVIVALFLLQERLLTWWIALFLVALSVFVEGLLFTNRKYSNKEYVR